MNSEFMPHLKLGRAERLQLVEDLWDSIAAETESLPLSDWQIAELRRRKETFALNPESGRSWDEVKQRARSGRD
jgi:putative addiction module component (TIGR02574 family)